MSSSNFTATATSATTTPCPPALPPSAGQRVAIIGHQKGRDTKENLLRNFGSAHPEGYRKALRLMRMAEKFSLPIVTLIDTPGAFPGIGAEERNIAEAIAFNLREMMTLRTPIVAIVIGEGGSGGALGIGIADGAHDGKRLLLRHQPRRLRRHPVEGPQVRPRRRPALKLSAQDLSKLGIIDGIVPEPLGGAHNDHFASAASLKNAVLAAQFTEG
jgi:acetyl-CoA carboxylase carboxyl transferase subunit alpha